MTSPSSLPAFSPNKTPSTYNCLSCHSCSLYLRRGPSSSIIGRWQRPPFFSGQRNLIGLSYWNTGLNQFVANRPIMEVDDLEGLNVGFASPIHQKIAQALGANPTPMDFAEVFTALETGLVDVAEGSTNLAAEKFLTQEPFGGNYYSEINIRPAFGIVAMRRDVWRQLPYKIQHDLAELSRKIGVQITSDILSKEEASREILREHGVVFAYLTEEDRQEFRDKMESVWEEVGGRVVEAGLLDSVLEILQGIRERSEPAGAEDRSDYQMEVFRLQFATDRADEGGEDVPFQVWEQEGELQYGEVVVRIPTNALLDPLS